MKLYKVFTLSVLLLLGSALGESSSVALASGSEAAAGTIIILTPSKGDERELLITNAETSLLAAGVGTIDSQDAELTGFDANLVLDCLDGDGECSDYIGKAPARWVMTIIIRRDDDNPKNIDTNKTIITKIYAAKDGSLLQIGQRICERCSSDERLAGVVTDLVTEIITSELDNKASDTFVQVDCKPEAILYIDGTVVGPTGQLYRVKPGDHIVLIKQEGYKTIHQPITVAANENKTLQVNMLRDSVSMSSPDSWLKKHRSLALPIIGAGVIGLGIGAYFYSVDGDFVDNDMPGKLPTEIRQTKNTAFLALGIGTALTGLGLYWWYGTRDVPPETVQISILPNTSGASFSVGAHF